MIRQTELVGFHSAVYFSLLQLCQYLHGQAKLLFHMQHAEDTTSQCGSCGVARQDPEVLADTEATSCNHRRLHYVLYAPTCGVSTGMTAT